MSFSGFSEDDIRKLENSHNFQKKNVKQKAIQTNNTPNALNNELKKKNCYKKPTPELDTDQICKQEVAAASDKILPEVVPLKPELCTSTNDEELFQSSIKNNQQEMKTTIDLDEFEARHKLIEEQNRKRKELLSKALADRTKRTQEESQRLNEIQNEFKKLDAILSNDVKILRTQIETACLEYTEAQKKYDRIEKEFLETKLLLFQKLEKKQMLTEHLCTIIEKNEERKAEKLNELLKKLNVDLTNPETDISRQEA